MILVDSSVLVAHLRGDGSRADRAMLDMEARGIPFAIPMVCLQEVMQGARDTREWNLLDSALTGQTVAVPADPVATYVAAARTFFDARRRGVTPRSAADCLIATIAIERGDDLLHADGDFERLRRVTNLRTLDVRGR